MLPAMRRARIIELLRKDGMASLKDMADAILAGAQSFAGGRLKDDASLVLVRRTETSPVLAEWHAIP